MQLVPYPRYKPYSVACRDRSASLASIHISDCGGMTCLLQVKALGCDSSSSLSSWLENLGLNEYLHNFLASGYRSLDCVKNLWELEIVNVRN